MGRRAGLPHPGAPSCPPLPVLKIALSDRWLFALAASRYAIVCAIGSGTHEH